MAYVIDPPAQPWVAVAGSDERFPVRRIYCVGRNYAAHAREMGADPDREPPFFFTKPADAVVPGGGALPFPSATENLHHEIELVVAIGHAGTALTAAQANDHIYGYAVGLDMTRRDLQFAARDKGRPWDPGKAFDRAAPIGPITPAATFGHPTSGRIWLDVNGERRQESDLANLIWSVPEIVAHAAQLWELAPGDLIFTGTPEGVGAVRPGDKLAGGIDGLGELAVSYRP